MLTAALAAAAPWLAPAAPPRVSPLLRTLAARAQTRRGWSALRRYARASSSPDARSLAYFALGYREYAAREYAAAAEDLARTSPAPFVLADYATYYAGLADQHAGHNAAAITLLSGFGARYPESVLRLPARNTLAGLLISTGRAEEALAVLGSEPQAVQTSAPVLRLTAQAESALGKDLAAAHAYQQIDISFPETAADRDALSALNLLRRKMGRNYPALSEEAETERSDHLFERGLYREALVSYERLLLASPGSPHRAYWRNRRAECLIALRRYSDAVAVLGAPDSKNPRADAERLALRVRAFELAGDQASMVGALDEIYRQYPESRFYADALAYAAGYFARQGFWQTAARYYRPLAQGFPNSSYAPEAAWRLAWYGLLSGGNDAALGGFAHFLQRYPKSHYAAAALYWLATTQEAEGDPEPAAQILRLLVNRYANTYYGLEARRKLPARGARGSDASALSAAEPALASLGISLPARSDPPLSACGDEGGDPLLAPFSALSALGLDDLAGQYIVAERARHPEDAELLLALARLRTAQKNPAAALFAAKQAVPAYELFPFRALPRTVWEWLYPRAYWGLVRRDARAEGIDPYLVMGVIRQESAFAPRALSSARARGLMQVEPGTAALHVRSRFRRRRIARSLYSPAYNVREGCRYLRELLREFNGNVPEALAAYNAGDVRVQLWLANSKVDDPSKFLETIPFTDTRAYVLMVLRDRSIYRALLTHEAQFSRCSPAAG